MKKPRKNFKLDKKPVPFPWDLSFKKLEALADRGWWPAFAVLFSGFLIWSTGFPNYLAKGPPEFLNALDWWLRHPFQAIPIQEIFGQVDSADGYASHCDKRTFRGTLPLLHILFPFGLSMVRAVGCIAGIGTLALAYRTIVYARKDAVTATLFIWALALSFSGPWPFLDTHYFGDGLAVFFLIGAMVCRRNWAVAMMICLAGFTDERAFFSSPLVGLWKIWNLNGPFTPGASVKDTKKSILRKNQPGWGVFWGMGMYLVIRFSIGFFGNVETGSSQLATLPVLLEHYYDSYPGRVFTVFEFLWSLPVLVLLIGLCFPSRSGFKWVWYPILMALAAVPAVLVRDIDRSLYYLLPGVILALAILPQPLLSVRKLLLVCVFGNLLYTPVHQFVISKMIVSSFKKIERLQERSNYYKTDKNHFYGN